MASQQIPELLETLHPLERRVLPHLLKDPDLASVVRASGLAEIEVMRAFQWLARKKIVNLSIVAKEVARLDGLGETYKKLGLPEYRLLASLKNTHAIQDLPKLSGLTQQEVAVSVGLLKTEGCISVEKGSVARIKDSQPGKAPSDLLLAKLPASISELSTDEREILKELQKRKQIVRMTLEKNVKAHLTSLGKQAAERMGESQLIEALDSVILQKKQWKDKRFRRYDVVAPVPRIYPGKKQPYRSFLDYVRRQFQSLGFTEMFGPLVEAEFWDMDALFMPQDHSARDIHSAYYVQEPRTMKINPSVLAKVRSSHEDGFNTGSLGWQYSFALEQTQRTILRTQGTACSARMLASKELQIPGKYFAIVRCFRPDIIDATHNVDFFQTEGIVVDEGLNLRHLKWLLKLFAEKFADTSTIKIKPGYFPFTEPSLELYARHPKLGWIELGGAGILRPEVVKPLTGKDISVLAWGIGIDRIGMFKLGIKDIRDLFSSDLGALRNSNAFY